MQPPTGDPWKRKSPNLFFLPSSILLLIFLLTEARKQRSPSAAVWRGHPPGSASQVEGRENGSGKVIIKYQATAL
jgi:hypothetical protein